MEIFLVSGVGRSGTTLSAFDAALQKGGIHNYNLLGLSSVIPVGSAIKVVPSHRSPEDEHGYLLYVVLAEARSERCGDSLAAGLAWYQLDDGRGVFAEHSELSRTLAPAEVEASVADRLAAMARDLCSHRGWRFEEARLLTQAISAQVRAEPTSVLVAAVYESQRFIGLCASEPAKGGSS